MHVMSGTRGLAFTWADTFRQDLRCGFRTLLHARAYTTWVVASLAIGMAVAIAALALLNAVLVLPFPEVTAQNRLVRVAVSRNCGRPDCWIPMTSPADYAALREGLTGLQGLAGYAHGEIAVALPDARSMRGVLASPNLFDVLGVRPAAGRAFNAVDSDTHAAVAVISHGVWTREFDSDASVIGRSIRVADEFVQIVGVAPPRFEGIDRVRPGTRAPDVWLPMWLADRVLPLSGAEQRREAREIAFVGRLKEAVELSEVQAEAAVVAVRLATSRGETSPRALAEVRGVWRVRPESWHLGVMVVMPIPILVLAIACVNAANLMLARGSQRRREIAIRLAIGAGRGRIVRQLLVESAMLALIATVVALPIAWWGLQIASNPLGVPIPFDPAVLVLTILTAAGTAVAFGLAPAVRVSAQCPSSTLGSAGARSDAAPRESRMRRLLIVAQVALSLGLLTTAWQLVATVRSQALSGGTPPDRLLIARFDLQPLRTAADEHARFYRELAAGASRLPGVEAAGVARHTSVWTFGRGAAPGSIVVWHPLDAPKDGRATIGGYADGDLFEAVGLRVVAGRGFIEADRQARPQVAVVNQTFAQSISPSTPLGTGPSTPLPSTSLGTGPSTPLPSTSLGTGPSTPLPSTSLGTGPSTPLPSTSLGTGPSTPLPSTSLGTGPSTPLPSTSLGTGASVVGSILRVAPREGDFNSSIEVRIVGVIEPSLEPRLTQDGPPAAKVYLPSPIEPEPALALYLRTHGAAAELAEPVRDLVRRIAPF
jgi:putative ABC transport system permease protein